MIAKIRRTLPLLLVLASAGAQAQFYKLKGAAVSVGGTGQFSTVLESNASNTAVGVSSPIGTLSETTSNNQQFTTDSAGVLGSLQFHPVAWAGVEVNYGYTHYSERFGYNLSSATGQRVGVPVGMHEATGAYEFHPPHIPFQPFVNIGGGAIYFSPLQNASQWRGTGLLEAGFDIPTHNKHLAFRAEGRSLVYRAPNFNTPALSTRSWRVTEEPSVSAVFRF